MKILVVSTQVFRCPPSGYSGLEFLAWQIAAGLAAKGHTVALAAPDESTCPNVEIIPCGPERQVDERTAFQRYQQHLHRFQCVIDHSWQKYCLLAKAQGMLKIPVLGVCHAPLQGMFSSMPPNVEKPCFVCISEDQGRYFEALFEKPCRVARNGVDTSFYKPLNLPRTDRFLFLARFSSVKGPDIAIQSCAEAGVGLDLVGDLTITNEPQYLEGCLKLAADRNDKVPGSVKVYGNAGRGECVSFFSKAHAFVHPNLRFREPLGLAPLEAQACGLPVVTFDRGALRETVLHGETGWIAKDVPGFIEGIKRYAGPIDQQTRDRCRQWVCDNFTVDKMVSRYEELCVEALDGGW